MLLYGIAALLGCLVLGSDGPRAVLWATLRLIGLLVVWLLVLGLGWGLVSGCRAAPPPLPPPAVGDAPLRSVEEPLRYDGGRPQFVDAPLVTLLTHRHTATADVLDVQVGA